MITPIEIQNKEFRRTFRGYNEEEVDEFLKIITDDFQSLYRENMDLQEKVKLYKEQVSRYKSIEETLNATLITAQTAAEDTCSAANKKAKIIVEEAELKSKQIILESCPHYYLFNSEIFPLCVKEEEVTTTKRLLGYFSFILFI